jgi:succinoglycan biosynthesis transport protein ExoP
MAEPPRAGNDVGLRGFQLMEKRTNSGESEALEPIEVPVIRGHQTVYPVFTQEENAILQYWRIVRKRKWWIVATVVVVFALSAIKTLRTTRLYQASSKIAIFPETPNVLGFKEGEDTAQDYQTDLALETQAAILRSDALAMKVIETMHLDQDPRFAGGGQALAPAGDAIQISSMEPDPARIAGLLGTFHGGLGVQILSNTRLVQISYTHPDPRLATEIANGLVKTFIEENFKTKYESVTQTSEWLSKELADLRLKVETSEQKLVRYQKDHSILGIDEKQNIVTAKLDELNKELTAAQSERIQKESTYKFATSGDPTLFAKVSPEGSTGLLGRLRDKEADLSTAYAQATTQFGPGYPKVAELSNQLKQVRAEIEEEEKKMEDRLLNQYLGALQREKLLESAFDQQKHEANKLNESAIEYTVLKRDAESTRQLYDNLLQRLKEAGVSAGLRSSNIRVVDVARTPTGPISPDIPRSLTFGFLLGLGGGIGLAFVMESLDRTVRDMEEVTAISTLPALGTIPLQMSSNGSFRKRLKGVSIAEEMQEGPALITYARPKSEGAEAYRALRTSILLSTFGAPPKVILVTSALPQEGKTTISANSALVLAQRGSRVLLVDADLRRPGVGKLFGLRPRGGLSTLISGGDKLEDVVFPFPEVPNLWILPAGPIPPQPAELLSSNVMKDYIERWRNEYDHIIIDSPPCLSVTDAVVLSPEADRVILVARSGQTTKLALRRACSLLMQVNARVMGVVLNALNLQSVDGRYYYSYGGSYSRHYYDDDSPKGETTSTSSSKVS